MEAITSKLITDLHELMFLLKFLLIFNNLFDGVAWT